MITNLNRQQAGRVMLQMLEEAYACAFAVSAEGYNGEIKPDFLKDPDWVLKRALDIEKITSDTLATTNA